jgi:hypothetical protein
MKYATPGLRRFATRLLELEGGGGQATSSDLADASGRLLDRLSQRLAQVIGPAGVEAIFLRAVKLRKAEFPFLGERIVPGGTGERLGEALRDRLRGQSPEVAREATVILVATFAGLLAILIGDRLAWGVLREVWPDTLQPGVEPQEAEE